MWSNMKEWISEHFVAIIGVIALILMFVCGYIAGIDDRDTWNNGYCECDGRWQYVESVTHTSRSKESTTTTVTYIYKCDRWGKMHEFLVLR